MDGEANRDEYFPEPDETIVPNTSVEYCEEMKQLCIHKKKSTSSFGLNWK